MSQRAKESAAERKKTSKAAIKRQYTKPAELVEFENEYNAHAYDKLQAIPIECRVRTRFRDDTANGLTGAIIAHIKHNGHFAARINTGGVYDTHTGKFRTSGARKGMADISAVINGKPVQIEIKAGKDKPRAEQLKVAAEYESAGGKYVFVHSFSEWVKIYSEI